MVLRPASPHPRPTSLPAWGRTRTGESMKGSPDNYCSNLTCLLSLPSHPIHLHSARWLTLTSSTSSLPLADYWAEWRCGPNTSSPTSTLPRSTPAPGPLYTKVPLSLTDHGPNPQLNVHTPEPQDANCLQGPGHIPPPPLFPRLFPTTWTQPCLFTGCRMCGTQPLLASAPATW